MYALEGWTLSSLSATVDTLEIWLLVKPVGVAHPVLSYLRSGVKLLTVKHITNIFFKTPPVLFAKCIGPADALAVM